jgi:chaperone modulatory protein CbpM
MRLTEQDVVARIREVSVVQLRVWVERGWVTPSTDLEGPTFDEIDLARIRLVHELREQLEIDEEALPVVLSLVDQLYGARRELRALIQAVAAEPDEVCRRIRARYLDSMGR